MQHTVYSFLSIYYTVNPLPGVETDGLLVSWFTGLLVYWFTCTLVYWCAGLLVYGFTGELVFWFTGSLVYWFTGLLVHCSLVHWFTGVPVYWFTCLLVCRCLMCQRHAKRAGVPQIATKSASQDIPSPPQHTPREREYRK